MLQILEERKFPVSELIPLASERSVGKTISFAGKTHRVRDLATFDFQGVDIGLFSAGGSVSGEHAPRAGAAGCVVIDNTSRFRYDADIPLIVPEVNAGAMPAYRQRNIIANPNCSTIQMVVALKPIYDAAGITRINVATYQSVSGAGRRSVDALAAQTAQLLNGQPVGNGWRCQADRLQRGPPHRRLPGQWLHQGRDEDGVGDPEDLRATIPYR